VVLLSIGLREETDESGRHGGRNSLQLTRSPLHHFYRHDPPEGLLKSPEGVESGHQIGWQTGTRVRLARTLASTKQRHGSAAYTAAPFRCLDFATEIWLGCR
jgi:hypothetical protein